MNAPLSIGFVGFAGVTALDLVGPMDAFAAANALIAPHAALYATIVLGATGPAFVAESGITSGFAAEVARLCPRVSFDPDAIFVRDGPYATSAGITAGIDLALALIEEDLGSTLALAVARELVV